MDFTNAEAKIVETALTSREPQRTELIDVQLMLTGGGIGNRELGDVRR